MKNLLRHDRLKHFFVGTLFFIPVAAFSGNVNGLIAVIILGLFKELYDKLVKKTYFDFIDLLYTILSGLIFTLLNLRNVTFFVTFIP